MKAARGAASVLFVIACLRAGGAAAQDAAAHDDPFSGDLRSLYAEEDAAAARARAASPTPAAQLATPTALYAATVGTATAPADGERPSPVETPRRDAMLIGASAAYGGLLDTRDGLAQEFSFALRFGGPHYWRHDAGRRVFAVDFGVQRVDAEDWHATTANVDVRDFWRLDTAFAGYVLLGIGAGDVVHGGQDGPTFVSALGAGMELALAPCVALDVELRGVVRLANDPNGDVAATIGGQLTAGVTVYLGT